MKNVAIVTIYGETNFGNKLQNYAVEQLYLKKNFNVTTIRYVPYQTNNYFKNILINLMTILKKNERYIIFEKFSKSFLHTSENKIKLNSVKKYSKYLNSFDYVSVGSDQVWNDRYLNKYTLNYFLLTYINPEKRIACAPSIASDKIKNKKLFANELKKYKLLSCREKNGVNILKKLLNRQIDHLMDPTLAISKEEWNKLISNSKAYVPQEKYIFVYILGETNDDYLKKIYNKYPDTKVVNILDIKTKFYKSGPIEFIDYIKNADIVITNSFHGLVFSIIYNKKIYVTSRKNTNMNSRILTLFEYFEIIEDNNVPQLIEERDEKKINQKLYIIQKKWDEYIASIR